MKCSKCNGEIDWCEDCGEEIPIGSDIYCFNSVDAGSHVHASCFVLPVLAKVIE